MSASPSRATAASGADTGPAGRTVVVTGAGRGIGLAVVEAFLAAGSRVVAGSRERTEALDRLVKQGADLTVVEVDLATPDGPDALVAEAVALHGGLDVLVNNVGALRPRVDGFLSVTDEDWDWTFTVNFTTAVRTTRAALPHLLATGAGRVVTVSSVNARLPDPLVIDYSAAKAALTNFCKALSKEVGPRGVRVNTVSPGPVETALWQGADGVAATVGQSRGVDPREVARGAADQSVTGRFTRPSEVAELVVYLAGPSAANITGADFVIDGGLVESL
ncbi:NAD(P)-dependent dehydrogenase (short-subunit alcohol dehydrogenase family) [Streptomyces sp. SAI-208]|uniref:SDR family NAD(P)-dependent oxidoreductase n=1 Tax=unclassified Streptomyces TaxID=2593676 RepID=UPI002475BBAD|nr:MULTISPECIES: SDR family oxidoreductase [unclassified Streptomyces]MDH6553694.1 NAD(P)-dependent dehydrogenase (short-subunit alcohol dehydrogenase family) [Streptomyces sp. SAI-041]MDH6572773.1 NAD(P)-dependent dehydrogenase (short-subunit alcohol dehydrogenase family) [Streptomyces sp. SAI-117]MDH6582265.1 NAD(P)-dependent dehydrogenase (short-subunit alcohol dehydrogenase family) [Streptomyces sp. SAI-133]MDH6612469.1 NAD(P)-dependent dehydrogenase (short-subunit alcohol dehydrogenase fam